MRSYFTRDRFGHSQFLAGLLLLAFLSQAVWLIRAQLQTGPPPEPSEAQRISEGWKQWHGRGTAAAPFLDSMQDAAPDAPGQGAAPPDPASPNSPPQMPVDLFAEFHGFDREHSPLLSLVTAAPLLAWPRDLDSESAAYWRWLPRLPFLACGLFLGASLWYVARRLCGNTGGFIALTFYCFSPALLQASAVWHTEPEILAAWGAFGTIFTAIAVAHTLYAPREVVLWNWRRIVLLGVSLTIAVGSQFSLIVVVPMALGFLLYVAPVRRVAGLVIWVAACAVGFVLLLGIYGFHLHAFGESMRHAAFWGATWRGFAVAGVYKQIGIQIGRASPALVIALPITLVSYTVWPRPRYFGNTAPLLVAALFLLLGMAHPHFAGAGFVLAAMPFVFIFVSGVLADLLETRYRPLVGACVIGMMGAYVMWSLLNLAHVPPG